jgi:hypothetical protein
MPVGHPARPHAVGRSECARHPEPGHHRPQSYRVEHRSRQGEPDTPGPAGT